MAQLTLTFVGRTVGVYELDRERLTIGRRPSNDLHIDNLAVSGCHAVVHRTGEGFVLEDVGSTNGTFVNEVPVQRHLLHSGDVIRVGKHELIYNAPEERSPSGPRPIDAAGTSVVTPLPSGDTSIALSLGDLSLPGVASNIIPDTSHLPPAGIRILNGSRRGSELRLDHARTRLGRPGKPGAVVTRTTRGYTVSATDVNEEVLVNDLPAKESHPLEDRDVIEIAGFQVEFFYLP